jgi:hypothetical protein
MRPSRLRASHLTALAVGVTAAFSGCGLVVGAGDYVIGNDASSTGDATSSVDAASGDVTARADGGHEDDGRATLEAAPSGDAVSAVDSGPPDGGSPEAGAGEGGPASLACAPDGGPLPQTFPAGSAALQQLVRACVLAESCDPSFFDVPLAACITNDYLDAFPSTACLAAAMTCDDYYACQGSRIATLSECPSADTDTGKCINGVSTNCFYLGGGTVSNCAVVGGTCTPYNEDDAGNTAAGCKIVASCPNTNAGTQCSTATQRFSCATTETGTIAIGQNCPQSSTCRTGTGGTHCYTNGPSCSTPGASCVSGNLSSCLALASGNQALTYKCSVPGLSCVASADGGTGSCVTPGCEKSDCTDSCDGDGVTLHTCIGGAQYDVDCTMFGFTGCDSLTPTGSSTLYTYCFN